MKAKIEGIGIAERQVIGIVLNEIPPSKSNRALVRSLRRSFNIKGLRHELNALRSEAIQRVMDESLADNLMKPLLAAVEKADTEQPITEQTKLMLNTSVERIVRTVVGPQVLKNVSLSWDELLDAEAETTEFEADATDLYMLRKHFEEKEEWAWNKEEEAVPPPSALHEALANLDEALEKALKKE